MPTYDKRKVEAHAASAVGCQNAPAARSKASTTPTNLEGLLILLSSTANVSRRAVRRETNIPQTAAAGTPRRGCVNRPSTTTCQRGSLCLQRVIGKRSRHGSR